MPCNDRWCQMCEVEETAPDLTPEEEEQHECPHCGGRTSGEGVTCADCRRVTDILGKDAKGDDPAEVSD